MASTKTFSHRGWIFTSIHRPISDAKDIHATLKWLDQQARPSLQENLQYFALHVLPEMYFGNNQITLKHQPTQATVRFLPNESLTSIEVGPLGDQWQKVKVKAAEVWQQRKDAQRARLMYTHESISFVHDQSGVGELDVHSDDIQVFKPYDWTFSTAYTGHITNAAIKSTAHKIPIEKLKIPEPILFYDENVLYEDELGDNGVSKYSIKLRVMPSGFLLLARHFLRVDHVQYAVRDNRIYHEFGTSHLLRERSVRIIDYQSIFSRAVADAKLKPHTFPSTCTYMKPRSNDGFELKEMDPIVLSLLVDENWVNRNMMEMGTASEVHQDWIDFNSTHPLIS